MVALIFVRDLSDPLTSLVKKIDRQVQEASGKRIGGKKLGVFVIVPAADGRADQLHALAKKESLQRVTLGIGNAPPRYEINKEADVTAAVYTINWPPRQQEVVGNFALRTGELDDARCDDILAALAKVLPK
jgi:hypothetical protein